MPFETRGAIVRSTPGRWEITELLADDPRQGEIQVRLAASGLCHSDDHLVTGDLPPLHLPMCGGHEGAGVVTAVGPHTPGWREGDHVVFSFLPGCGRCRWCANGMQYLCDRGANVLRGSREDNPASFRCSLPDGTGVGQMCGLGTFAEVTTVDVRSAVRIDDDIPLDVACLTGCAVGTGWGTAVQAGDVEPGDVVVVMGVGGIGINAVQGAAFAGASSVVAVDPVAFKRETALAFGATDAFADMASATEFVRSITNGQGADKALVTVGVTTGGHVAEAFAAVRKAGRVVVTGLGVAGETGIPVSLVELVSRAKEIRGSLFGNQNPSADIPRMLRLYREGHLKLDELITTRYRLEDLEQGYADLLAGRNIRGVVVY